MSLHEAALAAYAAGLCVLPAAEDGSKAPIGGWKRWQTKRPNIEQVETWWGPHTGIGVVCGTVSSGIEMIDFDHIDTYSAYKAKAVAVGLADLVERVEAGYSERSPREGSGVHWLYRCSQIAGNTKLAKRLKTDDEKKTPDDKWFTLIETRGEGGWVVIAPSYGKVHPTGQPYVLLRGGAGSIVTLSIEEKDALWTLARSFDQTPRAEYVASKPSKATGFRPGDEWAAVTDWREILEPHGWTVVGQNDGETYWCRPGKTKGISGTTNYKGSGFFYCFSTSTVFDSERGYGKFSAYAVLNHEGNFQAAAKALAALGFGTKGLEEILRKTKSKNAFEEATLEALARIQDTNKPLYEKTIKRFKAHKVRITKLEAAVLKTKRKLDAEDSDHEGIARHAHQEKQSIGWWFKQKNQWIAYPFSQFKTILEGRGYQVAKSISDLTDISWTIVNEPFQQEDLPDHCWNKDAAKLAYVPTPGVHPTWDQIFRVVGRGLDGAVAQNSWCMSQGVKTGGEFLLLWVASLFQRPLTRLPYLFFFGEENTGKSTFHEQLGTLMKPGYALANEALENKNGFNGELAGAILCAVEEIEVPRKAYRRIKAWVTGPNILIHSKGLKAYTVRNATHWIQTGNARKNCPVADGDTRIIFCQVTPPTGDDVMSKNEIVKRCAAEAPAFTHTILNVKLPEVVADGRMGVAVLETADKGEQQRENASPLDLWLAANYPEWLGKADDSLVAEFLESIPPQVASDDWNRAKVLQGLPNSGRVQRRLILALHAAVVARGEVIRCKTSEILDLVPSCRGDWPYVVPLGKFLATPRLPFVKHSIVNGLHFIVLGWDGIRGG